MHRYAVLVAASTALLFVSGPAVSSNEARPLYTLGQTHMWLGALVGLLTVGLAISFWRAKERAWVQRLAWMALGTYAVESLLGLMPEPLSAFLRISHSLLAQLFFSTTVAMVAFTSNELNQSLSPEESGALLKLVAKAIPALVFSQVALGIVFRHGIIGIAPHILWAFVVALSFLLVIAATRDAKQVEVRRAGVIFTVIAAVQILFGFALFVMQAVDADPTVIIVATAVHATTGALTLASTVMMAILIRRAR